MSSYQNVVVGKLKLKGKALDVKSGGVKKKKKQKHHNRIEEDVPTGKNDLVEGLYISAMSFFFHGLFLWFLCCSIL